MLKCAQFLSRLPLRAREVRIVRGFCRQIDWYTEQFEKLDEENPSVRYEYAVGWAMGVSFQTETYRESSSVTSP